MSFKATLSLTIKRALTAPPKDAAGNISPSGSFSTEKQAFEAECEANVVTKNGNVTIEWEDLDGRENSVTFGKNDPGLVTMNKTTPVGGNLIMVFEKGVRHLSISSFAGESIDIMTGCTAMSNTIMKNGKLSIKYFVEIHGFRAETTELRMTVRKRRE